MIKLRGMHDLENLASWQADRIDILGLQLSKRCNFGGCLYCFEDAGKADQDELSYPEIQEVIRQAHALGASRVFIAGAGEPFCNDFFLDLVRFVTSLDMWLVVYTNGSLITKEIAQKLIGLNISLMIKMDSLDLKHSNFLTQGQHWQAQWQGIENCMAAGFNQLTQEFTRLGLNAVYTQINEEDIEELVQKARENNLWLAADQLGVIGRAAQNYARLKPKRSYQKLQEKLALLFWWGYQECFYRNCGITVRHNGDVISCPDDIYEVVGNVRGTSLDSLLQEVRRQEPHYAHCPVCPIKQANLRRYLERSV